MNDERTIFLPDTYNTKIRNETSIENSPAHEYNHQFAPCILLSCCSCCPREYASMKSENQRNIRKKKGHAAFTCFLFADTEVFFHKPHTMLYNLKKGQFIKHSPIRFSSSYGIRIPQMQYSLSVTGYL